MPYHLTELSAVKPAHHPLSAPLRHLFNCAWRRLLKATLLAILAAATPLAVYATINPPSNFHTDAADFSDIGAPVNGVAAQFRWINKDGGVATGVQVEVSTNGSTFFLEKTLPGIVDGYDNAVIPWTSNRWYRIRAVNATDSSSYAGPIKVTGNMPPTRLSGSTSGSAQMTVTWDTAGGFLTGYTVQQSTAPDFSANLIERYVPGQSTTSLAISYPFALNTIYYFRVASTNANAGTGNSEFEDKPINYIAVAPNGPPVAPNFISEHMDKNANEALVVFDDVSLNSTAELLQYSTNGGSTWYSLGAPFVGSGTRYVVTHSGLTGGMAYTYRAASVNANGNGPFTTWNFTPPATPSGASTVWYVDLNATGNSTGTNWANAWESLGAINWSALGPGHVVYVSGGNYTNYLVTFTDGAYGNPILIKTATDSAHNGLVSMNGQICWKSSYVTIDGAKNDSYVPTKAEDTSNINLLVTGRSTADAGVLTYVARGAVLKFAEITGDGSPISGEGDGDGIKVIPETIGPTNSFFFNCYVHDVWGSGINQIAPAGYNAPHGVVFGTCYFLNYHNNCFACGNGWDVTNCFWGGWKGPGVGHPDGIQGGFENSSFIGNRMNYNCPSGSPIYMDITGVTSQRDFFFLNNLFYGGTLDMQFSLTTAGTPLIISNMWFAGNTFFGINQSSLSFVTGGTTGRLIKASHFVNNIFYTGTNGIAGNGGFSSGGTEYNPSDLELNYNVLTGTGVKGGGFLSGGKVVIYRTNNAPNIGLAGVCLFTDVQQFNAWSSLYKNNTSATNQFEQWQSGDYRLSSGDTVALGHGTNLSSARLPLGTNDVVWAARGQGAGWDIGAYQYTSGGTSQKPAAPTGLRVVGAGP